MPSSIRTRLPPTLAERLMRPWANQTVTHWEAPPERALEADETALEVDFKWVLGNAPDPEANRLRDALKRMGLKLPGDLDPREFVREGRLFLPRQRAYHFFPRLDNLGTLIRRLGDRMESIQRAFERVTHNVATHVEVVASALNPQMIREALAIREIQAQEDAEVFRLIDQGQWPVRTEEVTILPTDEPRTPVGWQMFETEGEVAINPSVVARRVTFPEFEIASNPTVRLDEIQSRRFDIFDRTLDAPPMAAAIWGAFLTHMTPRLSPSPIVQEPPHVSPARILLGTGA